MTGHANKPRARRFRPTGNTIAERPMSQLNITPLIDVLLVLLVMLMLSIPAALHKVEVNLPSGGLTEKPAVIHNLQLNAAGNTLLDGKPLNDAALRIALGSIAKDPEGTQLHFETDGQARYERFDQVVAMVKRAGIEKIGFVGNQKFARWD